MIIRRKQENRLTSEHPLDFYPRDISRLIKKGNERNIPRDRIILPTLCTRVVEKWKRRTGITCTGLRLLYVSFNEIAFNMQYTIMLTARIPSRVYAIHPQPKSNSFRNPSPSCASSVCHNRASWNPSLQMKRRRKIWREGSFDEHWIRVINFSSLFFSFRRSI